MSYLADNYAQVFHDFQIALLRGYASLIAEMPPVSFHHLNAVTRSVAYLM